MQNLHDWLASTKIVPELGVYDLTPRRELDAFERLYTELRKQEGRLYEDDRVKRLPKFPAGALFNEWKTRETSALRLLKYLKKKSASRSVKVMELGCGNGWLSRMLGSIPNSEILGLDVNVVELEQAARVFYETHPNLFFAYGDIFEAEIPSGSFDYIVMAASVQYFPDLTALIERLRDLLAPEGEIHIVDSPFYPAGQIEQAAARTEAYYDSKDFMEMSRYYHHHSREELAKLGGKWIDNPNNPAQKVLRWWFKPWHSPFGWVRL